MQELIDPAKPAREHVTTYTAKFKHGGFFSHKRIVLLNIVTVDTKHSRKSAMFEFCLLRYSIRNYMLPRRLRRLDELLGYAKGTHVHRMSP